MSERKRKLEEEASSTSVSPLNKKTKLNESDSSPDSHDVIVFAASSSSIASSAALASDECSVTTAGEENDQCSSINSGFFTSESKRIAKNSSSFGVDLETHEIKTETETFINNNFRKETSPVSESLGEATTEMESSSATERKQPKVSKTPTPTEIEDFFSELENDNKKQFIEKYNFDIVNDEPLEGRYKWDRP
ncbi:Cyclin-dependent kinase inhibitor [Arabidopsis suecica]|uniref:Cyclin-dependent kinase inhibitor n=1 Tax=Arabidopsis suecica TaxID=45249 RepID=A0A8T2B8S2_ARASU|nr:Cyclin-dependent kinase inhibitor [Arabidopsis suecica]